jgi:oxygen-independent coproporphyrinogen-3 oxidase
MGVPADKVEHLYVHVPFCAAKCNYCAFYSEAGSADKMEDYVDALLIELNLVAANLIRGGAADRENVSRLQPKTIFFGGGTPSLLPTPLMRRILEAVGGRGGSRDVSEWTIECNPSTVSVEKATLFREFGVNRISMGVQALDDELLDKIGRVHSVTGAIKSYERLREAGFQNINLDLIFGLPGQTMEHWKKTLAKAIQLEPEHLSTYCLILEEGTEFWRMYRGTGVSPVHSSQDDADRQAGRLSNARLPDDEEQLAMYETAIETLAGAGYRQYEISNFAKPGRECAHNIAYWEAEDYIGLGPSACSTVGDKRWQNAPSIDQYVAAMRTGDRALAYEEPLTPELRAAERAAFGMRMNAGVPAELLRGRWDEQVAELLSSDLVQWSHDRLQPTKRGILFADEVASRFV